MDKHNRKNNELSTLTLAIVVLFFALGIVSCSKNSEDKVYSGSWTVEYEYENRMLEVHGIASGAKAVAENGIILARAKLLGLVSDENGRLAVEVEEIHFDLKGRVKYRCISRFDFPIGRKSIEKNSKGIKHTDYFSTWPVRLGW